VCWFDVWFVRVEVVQGLFVVQGCTKEW